MTQVAAGMRRLVVVFHVALAIGLSVDAVWVLKLSFVNGIWEEHFYGLPSEHTAALVLFSLLAVGLGVTQLLASAVYLSGRDGGGTALLVGSIVLTCILQPPFQWLVIAVGFLILVETIVRRISDESTRG